ncbi:MAG: hypothetical protein IIA65_01785 [Planctomycetes bacterium]|nr:hypothetical protein [Planctomycetota bacterium]
MSGSIQIRPMYLTVPEFIQKIEGGITMKVNRVDAVRPPTTTMAAGQ